MNAGDITLGKRHLHSSATRTFVIHEAKKLLTDNGCMNEKLKELCLALVSMILFPE